MIPDLTNTDEFDKTIYTFSIGYEHKDFDFEARDLEQWYPSDPTKAKKTQEGKVITYDLSALQLGVTVRS